MKPFMRCFFAIIITAVGFSTTLTSPGSAAASQGASGQSWLPKIRLLSVSHEDLSSHCLSPSLQETGRACSSSKRQGGSAGLPAAVWWSRPSWTSGVRCQEVTSRACFRSRSSTPVSKRIARFSSIIPTARGRRAHRPLSNLSRSLRHRPGHSHRDPPHRSAGGKPQRRDDGLRPRRIPVYRHRRRRPGGRSCGTTHRAL